MTEPYTEIGCHGLVFLNESTYLAQLLLDGWQSEVDGSIDLDVPGLEGRGKNVLLATLVTVIEADENNEKE